MSVQLYRTFLRLVIYIKEPVEAQQKLKEKLKQNDITKKDYIDSLKQNNVMKMSSFFIWIYVRYYP